LKGWTTERNKAFGLGSALLVTATILFSLYERYALGAMPHRTAQQFGDMLKMQRHYDARGWLFSVAALIFAFFWFRSSKHLGSRLVLGLGAWICFVFTLALIFS
jgi:hypothetical protein